MGIKVIFFDCDGTLTKVKSSWEYIHRGLGIWENRADEYQRLFRKGLIDYDEFCRRDALLWKGLALGKVMELVNQIPYRAGAKETVSALRGMGVFTAIISTGLSFLVERARAELGIDAAVSNELLTEKTPFSERFSLRGLVGCMSTTCALLAPCDPGASTTNICTELPIRDTRPSRRKR
jgi:HAD superfamily PSPase-like hydrolase